MASRSGQHADVKTTLRYLDVGEDDKRRLRCSCWEIQTIADNSIETFGQLIDNVR